MVPMTHSVLSVRGETAATTQASMSFFEMRPGVGTAGLLRGWREVVRITERRTELFHLITTHPSKKIHTHTDSLGYIYIYIYICVCVCICYIYIYTCVCIYRDKYIERIIEIYRSSSIHLFIMIRVHYLALVFPSSRPPSGPHRKSERQSRQGQASMPSHKNRLWPGSSVR